MKFGALDLTTEVAREDLFERARAMVSKNPFVASGELSHTGSCLLYARALEEILVNTFLLPRQMVMAVSGSARWRMVPVDEDDGECATHFAYEFQDGSGAANMKKPDPGFIEMHSWVQVKTYQGRPSEVSQDVAASGTFILDASAGYQPEQAEKLMGLSWSPRCLPPRLLVSSVAEMIQGFESGVVPFEYMPSVEAIAYARHLIARMSGPVIVTIERIQQ